MLQIVTAIFSMVGKKDDMKDADPKEKVEKIFSLMDTVSYQSYSDDIQIWCFQDGLWLADGL